MTGPLHLQLNTWAPDVKKAVNDFVDLYGKNSPAYSPDSYAVFDFDNTTCIFDVQDQCLIYQLETMSFPLCPAEFRQVLKNNIGEEFLQAIDAAMDAYENLYNAYGPFEILNGINGTTEALNYAKGINDSQSLQLDQNKKSQEIQLDQNKQSQEILLDQIINSPDWRDFASIMGSLAIEIPKHYDNWKLRWLAGLTEGQVYNLCYNSCKKYSQVETFKFSVQGDGSSQGSNRVQGARTFDFICGLTVTDNTRELWRVLSENGIDVWVCSSSELNQIKAAVDYFGLAPYCTGVVAKTMKRDQDGRLTWEYDFEDGFGYLKKDGQWSKDQYAVKASCRDKGKVKAIDNAIAVHYHGAGPLAGFMDSTGDLDFCTGYDNTKLVICYNRGDRTMKDGGGLISVVAIYQRDVLHYDLAKANEQGDTFYVLQGRDENGMRAFRPSNSAIIFDTTDEKLFASKESFEALENFKENNYSTKEIIAKWQ